MIRVYTYLNKVIICNLRFVLNLRYLSEKKKTCPLSQLGIDEYDIQQVLSRSMNDIGIQPVDVSTYFDVSMNTYQLVDKFVEIYKELYINLQLLK